MSAQRCLSRYIRSMNTQERTGRERTAQTKVQPSGTWCAFTCPVLTQPFLKGFLRRNIHEHLRITSTSKARRRTAGLIITSCITSPSPEPVEDGVTLPNPGSPESLHEERRWLQRELTDWLDSEWRQAEPAAIHSEIGQRTGQVYERQRMEGENDLTSVMLAIGSELEGMDFSGAFVGPWNVANRAAELLLNNAAGERIRLKPYIPEEKEAWLSQPKDVTEDDVSSGKAEPDGKESEESENTWGAVSPSLADQFERLKFLRDVIDGSASKELVDGAIAAVMNFRYDVKHGTWDGSDVDDEFFRQFGDMPPDTLGSEDEAELTDTLKYLNAQLTSEIEKSEDLAASLDLVVETLNGSDLTEIQRADENDHKFRKREIVAKWLHLLGGF